MAAFCLATLLFVPVNFVIAATGALFGPLLGLLYALVGALLGAGLSFAIGRGLGREWVRRIASRRLNAINKRLERHGLLAMTVLRLLPIAPFTVVNLVAGASEIRARDYMLGSLFGMAPGHRPDDLVRGSAWGMAARPRRCPTCWWWSGLRLRRSC